MSCCKNVGKPLRRDQDRAAEFGRASNGRGHILDLDEELDEGRRRWRSGPNPARNSLVAPGVDHPIAELVVRLDVPAEQGGVECGGGFGRWEMICH